MDEERRGQQLPAEITHLIRERSEARKARDWDRADELKLEIEEQGWKVVDSGGRTVVTAAAPPDVDVDGVRRYGSWRTVPTRLEEPAREGVCVVLVASEEPDRATRLVESLASHAAEGTQLVVVVNDPSAAQEAALPGYETAANEQLRIDVVRTSTRLGIAAALNIGLRLTATDTVILADGSAWPTGDATSPVRAALADPAVGVVGGYGLESEDRASFRPSGVVRTEERDVLALELAWLGFRRADYVELGPLNEGFATPAWLDVWWSFRLRGDDGTKTAIRLELPLSRQASEWPPARTHHARRNSYRVIRAFGADRSLLTPSGE